MCASYSLQDGRSALHYACGVGNYEVVKVLLNNFANVNLLAKVSVNIVIVVRSSVCTYFPDEQDRNPQILYREGGCVCVCGGGG